MIEYLYSAGVTHEHCYIGVKICLVVLALIVAIVLTVDGKEG